MESSMSQRRTLTRQFRWLRLYMVSCSSLRVRISFEVSLKRCRYSTGPIQEATRLTNISTTEASARSSGTQRLSSIMLAGVCLRRLGELWIGNVWSLLIRSVKLALTPNKEIARELRLQCFVRAPPFSRNFMCFSRSYYAVLGGNHYTWHG